MLTVNVTGLDWEAEPILNSLVKSCHIYMFNNMYTDHL